MKNALIGILFIVSVGSLAFGYTQYSKLEEAQTNCASEKLQLEKQAREQQVKAAEFQKMAEQAHHQAEVQRAICEEQLKAMSKK